MGNRFSKFHKPSMTESTTSGQETVKPEFNFTSQAAEYHWTACTKNPGHEMFIPVKEFRKDHLPLKYRSDKTLHYVLAMSYLTVRLVVSYTSTERPVGDSQYVMRGKKFVRFGSGKVIRIQWNQSDDSCPCQACEEGNKRRNIAASVYITSVKHVVFDTSEAKETIVDLFYDDEVSKGDIKSLRGFRVVKQNAQEDWCMFECLTHDEDLIKNLMKRLEEVQEYDGQHRSESTSSGTDLAVIVSHPHGRSKMVTIGEAELIKCEPVTHVRKPTLNHPIIKGEKIIFGLGWTDSDGSVSDTHNMDEKTSLREETQPAGIEVMIMYPDQTNEKCLIWQFDQPVVETKKFLLEHGGINEPPEMFVMVMELPNDERQVMDDAKEINYYWDDLTRALQICFENGIAGAVG